MRFRRQVTLVRLPVHAAYLTDVAYVAHAGSTLAQASVDAHEGALRQAVDARLIRIRRYAGGHRHIEDALRGAFLNGLCAVWLNDTWGFAHPFRRTMMEFAIESQRLLVTASLIHDDAGEVAFLDAASRDLPEIVRLGVRGARAVSVLVRALCPCEGVKLFMPTLQEDAEGIDLILLQQAAARAAALQVKSLQGSAGEDPVVITDLATAQQFRGQVFEAKCNEWIVRVIPMLEDRGSIAWFPAFVFVPVADDLRSWDVAEGEHLFRRLFAYTA